jgi:hypothetical protein
VGQAVSPACPCVVRHAESRAFADSCHSPDAGADEMVERIDGQKCKPDPWPDRTAVLARRVLGSLPARFESAQPDGRVYRGKPGFGRVSVLRGALAGCAVLSKPPKESFFRSPISSSARVHSNSATRWEPLISASSNESPACSCSALRGSALPVCRYLLFLSAVTNTSKPSVSADSSRARFQPDEAEHVARAHAAPARLCRSLSRARNNRHALALQRLQCFPLQPLADVFDAIGAVLEQNAVLTEICLHTFGHKVAELRAPPAIVQPP